MDKFIKLKEATKEEPKLIEYLNIIKEVSDDYEIDFLSLEFLLVNHTPRQVLDFMPRYMELV